MVNKEDQKTRVKQKKKVVFEEKSGPQIKARQNVRVKKSALEDEVNEINKIVLISEK